MEALLEKERELQRLNAELDEKQRKLSAASLASSAGGGNQASTAASNPRKKHSVSASSGGRGRGVRPRCGSLGSSRPASRSTESEKDLGGADEKFVWAPIKGGLEGSSSNFIWAPISQEELFQEAKEKQKELVKRAVQSSGGGGGGGGKKGAREALGSTESNKGQHQAESQPGPEEHEVKFINDEEEVRVSGPVASKVEATQLRMLNIKIRGLETTLDKVSFEKSEVVQEKEQVEKELKVVEEQKRRLEATTRNVQSQLEKSRGELVELRHQLGKSEEECTLLKREVEDAKRDAKKNLSKKSSADVRLNRALEDAAKLKGELLAAERERKDAKEGGKKTIDELTLKTKFLEKQRNELLHGFKKQMELIDVLKRQKLHLEAAHVLKYTEEEFMQTLDWKPSTTGGVNSQARIC